MFVSRYEKVCSQSGTASGWTYTLGPADPGLKLCEAHRIRRPSWSSQPYLRSVLGAGNLQENQDLSNRTTNLPPFGNLVDFQPLLGLRLGYSCWKPARTGTSQDWFFLRGSYSTCYLVALECTIHNIEHDIGQIFNVGGIPEGPVPSTWTYSVLAGGFTVVWYNSGKQVFLQRASCVVDQVLI